MLQLLNSFILGIIQGITEWLPISSTGHLILAQEFFPISQNPDFKEMFEVVIQFGSILAVIFLYFNKLNPLTNKKTAEERAEIWSLWFKVLVAVVPAAVIGIIFDDKINEMFFNPITVAVTLILYGVLFIIVEKQNKPAKIESFSDLSYKTALLIGVFQILALIPGTSRSGSTILGAVILGSSRFVAAEFSFFLAIPVMFGASLLKLFKLGLNFSGNELAVLLTGTIVSFIVSIFAIKFLISYIKKHDFKAFGCYRIILGIIVLLYFTLI